jgi:hypothetical protein
MVAAIGTDYMFSKIRDFGVDVTDDKSTRAWSRTARWHAQPRLRLRATTALEVSADTVGDIAG